MLKVSETSLESASTIKRILKGTAISILFSIVLLFIYSILLTYTKISENTMGVIVIIITAISILVGSLMCNFHIKKNGILNGGAIGAIYILFIYILSSIITGNFGMTIYSIIMAITAVVSGGVGRNNRS